MNCGDIKELAPLHLAGELPEAQRALFDAHLSQCRSCAEEMERQAAIDVRVRDAFSAELPSAASLERSVRGQIGRQRTRRVAIAAAAGLLVAAVLGYRAWRPERVYADAALDHRLEVMEHQPRRWRSDPVEIEKLAARYSLPATALELPGYRLEHAKMCGIDGRPALHLVYTNGSQEFSIFVRRRTGAGNGGGLRTVRVGSEHLAGFQTDVLDGVVATGGSSGECLQFARAAAML
jgi:anti-sigma factor RsiW